MIARQRGSPRSAGNRVGEEGAAICAALTKPTKATAKPKAIRSHMASAIARCLVLVSMRSLFFLLSLAPLLPGVCDAQDAPVLSSEAATSASPARDEELTGKPTFGIIANPGATDTVTGSGWLGRFLGFTKDSGVRLGGIWIGDTNYLVAGGLDPRTWSFNSMLIVDLNLDLKRLLRIPGATFDAQFLQFNGQNTNGQAGVVTNYNGLPGAPPLQRSELYQLWWRQSLFDDKLTIKVGKSVTTSDFNNVTRPLSLPDAPIVIPSLSGLIYMPVFLNPTLLGVSPGYYNSAYGITTTVAPINNLYLSYGIYDGNGARGVQTGLNAAPKFNGYYFNVGEVGYAWRLGADENPGQVAAGAWGQTGKLSAAGIEEEGAKGFYAFGHQRLWIRGQGADSQIIIGFAQFGINDSHTMPVNKYLGMGITGFGLVPGRTKDSAGVGVAVSWLNEKLGFRSNEVLLAAYYDMHLVGGIYFQPTVTYVPNPGQMPGISAATAVTLLVKVLF